MANRTRHPNVTRVMVQSTFNAINDNLVKHTMMSDYEWFMVVAKMILLAVIDIQTQSPIHSSRRVYSDCVVV